MTMLILSTINYSSMGISFDAMKTLPTSPKKKSKRIFIESSSTSNRSSNLIQSSVLRNVCPAVNRESSVLHVKTQIFTLIFIAVTVVGCAGTASLTNKLDCLPTGRRKDGVSSYARMKHLHEEQHWSSTSSSGSSSCKCLWRKPSLWFYARRWACMLFELQLIVLIVVIVVVVQKCTTICCFKNNAVN